MKKPFYKRWWFWVLAVILVSNLATKIPEIIRERNQQEAAQIIAERTPQAQAEPVAEPEDDGYTEEEQAAAAKEYYEKIGYDPTQEVPEQEIPDDGISYIVSADTDTESADDGTASDSLVYTQTYILNTNTHKFHRPGCSSVGDIKPENYSEYTGTRQSVLDMGYQPCGRCDP